LNGRRGIPGGIRTLFFDCITSLLLDLRFYA
jgi:hypothetical protein